MTRKDTELGWFQQWIEWRYWLRRLRRHMRWDRESLLARVRKLGSEFETEMHRFLPVAVATLDRIERIHPEDCWAIVSAMNSVTDDLEAGRITLRDELTPVTIPVETAREIQSRILYHKSRRTYIEAINLHYRLGEAKPEEELTHGRGFLSRPLVDLRNAIPAGSGATNDSDHAVILQLLVMMLKGEARPESLHYLTAFELEVAEMLLTGIERDMSQFGVEDRPESINVLRGRITEESEYRFLLVEGYSDSVD